MPGSPARAVEGAAVERVRIVGVGAAGQQQLDGEASRAQQPHRGDRVEHALSAQHARDQRHR